MPYQYQNTTYAKLAQISTTKTAFFKVMLSSLLRPLTEPTPGRGHRRGDRRAAGADRQVRFGSDVGRRAYSIRATGVGECVASGDSLTYRGQPNRRFFASRTPASRAWRQLVNALAPHRHVHNAASRAPTRSGTARNRAAASSPSTRESRWCHSAYRRHAGRGCASARGPPVRVLRPGFETPG